MGLCTCQIEVEALWVGPGLQLSSAPRLQTDVRSSNPQPAAAAPELTAALGALFGTVPPTLPCNLLGGAAFYRLALASCCLPALQLVGGEGSASEATPGLQQPLPSFSLLQRAALWKASQAPWAAPSLQATSEP